jgi:hypothetical protein
MQRGKDFSHDEVSELIADGDPFLLTAARFNGLLQRPIVHSHACR